jgi:Family of unknown function (DUF6922)
MSDRTMMNFSPGLFWDCDPTSLDRRRHDSFIIQRVLSRGTRDDWRELRRHYSDDDLRDRIVRLRSLDRRTVAFCAAYFQLPLDTFACLKNPSSIPAPGDC